MTRNTHPCGGNQPYGFIDPFCTYLVRQEGEPASSYGFDRPHILRPSSSKLTIATYEPFRLDLYLSGARSTLGKAVPGFHASTSGFPTPA